jgi:hypothetical protein
MRVAATDACVRIGDDLAGLALKPSEQWGRAHPATLTFWIGAVRGVKDPVELEGLEKFREALVSLHTNLTGEARIETRDRDFSLAFLLEGSTGRLTGDVVIAEIYGPAKFNLTYSIHTDQSYLPEMLRSIDRLIEQTPS